MNYDQLLFSELRLVSVSAGGEKTDDSALVKAMTVNEELLALGYTLAPKDIAVLSQSKDIDGFVSRVREYIGDVKADPMYPGFPEQVMAMDEAVFRFHQMLHYLSTYGVELFTGEKVSRGWLPESGKTEKTESDDALLDAKLIALIDEDKKYSLPYRKILVKTERMDDKERMIIGECIKHLSADELCGVNVTFKQNLLDVFNALFVSEALTRDEKLEYLHALCQHTGDVLKCVDYALTRARFHFRTSQKRLLVKLLESYPEYDFRSNLIISNKKGERAEFMLQYLDYNEYSRKPGHAKAVAELRSGELRSWESGAKFLAERGLPEALACYAERPGMMLRSLTYLLRNGYDARDIYALLLPAAKDLKTQTLVSIVSHFSSEKARWEEAAVIKPMVTALLRARLAANETPLRGKMVYFDMPGYDIAQSAIRVTDKSAEGGYIRSGLAYRIPDEVKRLRFFIYWNDKNRVDVDLHASANGLDGKQITVGWNSNYKSGAMVFSGDITHSDAAEYVDIDLELARDTVDTVTANINLFSGYPTFREIDECFVGAMAVNKTGEEVAHYDPKNCFFCHYLTGKYRTVNYGYVDVQNRVIVFDGLETKGGYYSEAVRNNAFSVKDYLELLLGSQNAVQVSERDVADVVLVMGKPSAENEVSLIDNNFFMETPGE